MTTLLIAALITAAAAKAVEGLHWSQGVANKNRIGRALDGISVLRDQH